MENKLKVHIYKGNKKANWFLFVRENQDVDKVVPKELMNKFGLPVLHRKMTLNKNEKRIALDSNEAIANIEKTGYYFNEVRIEVKMSTSMND